MRQVASVGHYLATVDARGLQFHQYASAHLDIALDGGRSVVLEMETRYPWDGQVKVTVADTDGAAWTLALRVPGWCTSVGVRVNGTVIEDGTAGGIYIALNRAWQPGDVVELDLAMSPRLTAPHPRVDATRGSLAIERGPMVYCLEGEDQEAGVDLLDVRLAPDADLADVWRDDLLDGVVTVEAQGSVADVSDWDGTLYRSAMPPDDPTRPVKLTAVPYYAWANRSPGTMRVWIPQT